MILYFIIAGAWLLYVRTIRFQRLDSLLFHFAFERGIKTPPRLRSRTPNGYTISPTRAEYPLTPAEAQKIVLLDGSLEMPFLIEKALEFALFKTYGIETIAKILLSTGQLCDPATAGRRYVDTVVLINSWITYPLLGPGSGAIDRSVSRTEDGNDSDEQQLDPRSSIAIARMNILHSHYKISNDDFLYTLSVFILEPPRFAKKYDWREFSPLEEMATFIFWSEIGRRMNITGIPNELEELRRWSVEYERNMQPSAICAATATPTIDLLLYHVPLFLRGIGTKAVISFLDDPLREAILAPRPPAYLPTLLNAALLTRAFIIKHFFLPRTRATSVLASSIDAPAFPSSCSRGNQTGEGVCPEGGRVSFVNHSNNERWYNRNSRSLLVSILSRWVAPMYPATPVAAARSKLDKKTETELQMDEELREAEMMEGYRLESVGPIGLAKVGIEKTIAEAEKLLGAKLSGFYRPTV